MPLPLPLLRPNVERPIGAADRVDASLAQFAGRALAEAFPYLILDSRFERVREAGVIVSQAVLIAIGIDWDGRRQVLAVELANRQMMGRRGTEVTGSDSVIICTDRLSPHRCPTPIATSAPAVRC
jgi:Transposase, Mutator family